jgi:hypothetical protein
MKQIHFLINTQGEVVINADGFASSQECLEATAKAEEMLGEAIERTIHRSAEPTLAEQSPVIATQSVRLEF